MWGIMRKDWNYFLVATIVILPVLLTVQYIFIDGIHPVMLLVNLVAQQFLALGPILLVEHDEEKNRGYVFLAYLPLTKREIVQAKFLLAMMSVVLVTTENCLLIGLSGAEADTARIALNLFIINGIFGLVLAGIIYNGIFGIGYTRFMVAIGVVSVFLGMVPPMLMTSKKLTPRVWIPDVVEFLKQMDAMPWIAVVLFVYVGLMLGAMRTFSFEPHPTTVPWK